MEKQATLPPKAADVMRRLLAAAMKLLYATPQSAKSIVQMVRASQDPIDGVVRVTGMVLGQLQQKARGIPGGVLARLAVPVSALVAEICVAAGALKDDGSTMAKIVSRIQQQGRRSQVKPQEQPAAKVPTGGLVQNAMGA